MKIQFWVADDAEREALADLGHRLFSEKVKFERGDSTWRWQMLASWSYDALRKF
ncbi:hypothetical protein [Pseudomonas putida]|uniref:hypothetical protein n=1 Tax=Pseudomonas putida TaxID=303 RepID=UPI0018FED699|nr:hypothetical protein [Pseudomonas putida]